MHAGSFQMVTLCLTEFCFVKVNFNQVVFHLSSSTGEQETQLDRVLVGQKRQRQHRSLRKSSAKLSRRTSVLSLKDSDLKNYKAKN